MLVNSSWPPVVCGVGDYGQKLMTAFSNIGHQCLVLTSAQFDTSPYKSKNLEVKPIIRRWDVLYFYQLIWPILRFRPTQILFQYPAVLPAADANLTVWGPILIRILFPWIRVCVIIHEYQQTLAANRQALVKTLRWSNRVIVFNQSDLSEMGLDNVVNGSLSRMGSAIGYVPAKERPIIGPYIVYFGLQQDKKGLGDILEALTRTEGLQLALIGRVDLRYQDLAKKLGIEDRVHWVGVCPEAVVSQYLQYAICSVSPFHGGVRANSTSTLAAIVNLCPVITTFGPQTPPNLLDSSAITMTPEKNPPALAKAITQVLKASFRNTHKSELQALADMYEWDKIAQDMLEQLT